MGERHNGAVWLVDRHVEEGRGSRTAIRCEGVETTYGELQAELFRAQHAIDRLGVGEGARIALVLDDDVAFPAWFLGAQRSGVVPVPLSTMLTGAELGSIIADAGGDRGRGLRVVLVDGRRHHRGGPVGGERGRLW